jgi:hypothetical protein
VNPAEELKRQAIHAAVYDSGLAEGHANIRPEHRPPSRVIWFLAGVATVLVAHKARDYFSGTLG